MYRFRKPSRTAKFRHHTRLESVNPGWTMLEILRPGVLAVPAIPDRPRRSHTPIRALEAQSSTRDLKSSGWGSCDVQDWNWASAWLTNMAIPSTIRAPRSSAMRNIGVIRGV